MLKLILLLCALMGLAYAQDCAVFELCEFTNCSGTCEPAVFEEHTCIQHSNDTDSYFKFAGCGENVTLFEFFSDSACTTPTTEFNITFPSCDLGHNFVECVPCESVESDSDSEEGVSQTIIVLAIVGGVLLLVLVILFFCAFCRRRYEPVDVNVPPDTANAQRAYAPY